MFMSYAQDKVSLIQVLHAVFSEIPEKKHCDGSKRENTFQKTFLRYEKCR